MKSIYTITFLSLSISIYAQENKMSELQDQAQVVTKAKEMDAKMMNSNQENPQKKQSQYQLTSEQGLEIKKQDTKVQASDNNNTGKLLPNTASLEEILATIPNRQARKANDFKNTNSNVQGLPNTATLEEIKKTIPKN